MSPQKEEGKEGMRCINSCVFCHQDPCAYPLASQVLSQGASVDPVLSSALGAFCKLQILQDCVFPIVTSQKYCSFCLKSQSNCWHLLTFCTNSSLLVGFEINFRYLDTKTQNMTFFPTGTGGEEAAALTIYQKGGCYI
jgi:hypothetical protein